MRTISLLLQILPTHSFKVALILMHVLMLVTPDTNSGVLIKKSLEIVTNCAKPVIMQVRNITKENDSDALSGVNLTV